MDLGTLGLGLLSAGMGEGQDSGKKGKDAAGEMPAQGVFSALISALAPSPAQHSAPAATHEMLGDGALAMNKPVISVQTGSAFSEAGSAGIQNVTDGALAPMEALIRQSIAPEMKADGRPMFRNADMAAPNSLSGNGGENDAAEQLTALMNGDKTAGAQHGQIATTGKPPNAANARVNLESSLRLSEVKGIENEAERFFANHVERSETGLRIAPATSAITETSTGRSAPVNQPSGAQTVMTQVIEQMHYAVRGGHQQIRFQLHPAELGHVSIQLRIRDGATKVLITAETPLAVETMRQAAGALHQSLQAVGVQIDRENLQFQQAGGFGVGDEARRDNDRGGNREDQAESFQRNTAEPIQSTPEEGLFL